MSNYSFTKSDCVKGALAGAFVTAAMGVVGGGLTCLVGSSIEAGVVCGSFGGVLMAAWMAGNTPKNPENSGKFALSTLGGGLVAAGAITTMALL